MDSVKLILLRHGESVWNKKNIFTGWVDVALSEKGVKEAIAAGDKIKNIDIDVVYTSKLIRAHMTLFLACMKREKSTLFMHEDEKLNKIYDDESKKNIIPVYSSWRLNERMYGSLQGVNKDRAREKYGKEQVHIWRRSFDIAPPDGESLFDTKKRTIPYFEDKIVSSLKEGKNVLISAHGNSLRSIVMELDGLSKEQVISLEIPTGEPIVYSYDGQFHRE